MPIPEISVPRSSLSAGIPTERTLVEADLGSAAVLPKNNADDIEATGRRLVTGQPPEVLPGDRTNMLPFLHVNRGRRRREIGAGPGFDFDEAKNAVVPADQVNLTSVVGDAEVCSHNPVAQRTQVEVCLDFTLLANAEVLWFLRETPAR